MPVATKDEGPAGAPTGRRFPLALLVGGLVAVVVLGVLVVVRASSAGEQVTLPDHVLVAGGNGEQAWTVVVSGERYGDDPAVGCAELRDARGVRGAAGCGYRPDDRSSHRMSYLVGELPGGAGQVWFGPAPAAAATVEFRFPGESAPQRVATVAVDGLPGRFYALVHRAPGDLGDPASFPDVVVTDGAGQIVVV